MRARQEHRRSKLTRNPRSAAQSCPEAGIWVKVKERKSGQTVVVSLTDNTKIECKKGKVEFFRRKDMDATAMVPGLTVDAEGAGNFKGQLVANKITFALDEFAIEVAEEQQ